MRGDVAKDEDASGEEQGVFWGGLGLVAAGLALMAIGVFWLRRPDVVARVIKWGLDLLYYGRPPGGFDTPTAGAVFYILAGIVAIIIGIVTIARALS